ncbi:MAG: TIGR03751 family conjugal transfer lipoprotein [Saezia sp.]
MVLAAIVTLLVGCSTTSEELLTHGDQTMMEVWNQGTGGAVQSNQSRHLMDAREILRRPLNDQDYSALSVDQMSYTRTAQNEIYSQFKRLPNPDLMMYVFPHLAGTDPVPVPGYTTIFPLYQRVQYALPGERTEAY